MEKLPRLLPPLLDNVDSPPFSSVVVSGGGNAAVVVAVAQSW